MKEEDQKEMKRKIKELKKKKIDEFEKKEEKEEKKDEEEKIEDEYWKFIEVPYDEKLAKQIIASRRKGHDHFNGK